jgi:hypothetical protein
VRRIMDSIKLKIRTFVFLRVLSSYDEILHRKSMRLNVGARELLKKVESLVPSNQSKDWCVILHGKIYDENFYNYLTNNLRSFRNSSKDLNVILATYKDAFYPQLETLASELDIELLAVEDVGPLPNPYPRSLGQQIATISAGIEKAKSLNIKYVAKLRVDQSIELNKFIPLANKVFDLFPPANEKFFTRVWSTSYNTYTNRHLGISDMFMFGATDVMSIFWEKISPEEIVSFNADVKHNVFREILYNFSIPETWLGFRFMKSVDSQGIVIDDLNSDFWKNYAGVVNAEAIGFTWGKSNDWLTTNFHSINWFGDIYSQNLVELRFEDWLTKYS